MVLTMKLIRLTKKISNPFNKTTGKIFVELLFFFKPNEIDKMDEDSMS